MSRFAHLLLVAALLSTAVHGAGLPDTGQDTCYNDTIADTVPASSAASIARDAGTHPGQDCRYGRDAAAAASALVKTGAGTKGFDYTKIGNNGATLAATVVLGVAAAEWACTRDNVTGLTWEMRTAATTDLRSTAHTYTWYNSDPGSNGGHAGSTGSNTCSGTLPGSLCNTEAYVSAVNAAALCGYADWRMPTSRELFSLVSADGTTPAIDATYFPDTAPSNYWTWSTYVDDDDLAWAVNFRTGGTPTGGKNGSTRYNIRLVRGGLF